MRKSALIAATCMAVVFGVTTSTSSALVQSNTQDNKFVKSVLLASSEAKTANETKATDTKVADETKSAQPAAPSPVIVTVASGDSLSSIAEAHSTTWVRLYNANESIANPNIINPGDQVRVPTADEQLADRPLPQPVVVAAPVAQAYSASYSSYRAPAAPAAAYPTDPNAAKAFIYSRESGNNPNATNPNGCYGIGQDCNGVLRSQCGADYACQDAYFTGYAMRRYGSWEAAQAFWQANHWW
ncbi:LysM peptidoglycan-binding domain-containing protein [Candidatus Saccharibacteria bacterium]|nr:LysM peptidoglycan-binding domain-containing protein [Candidatus Saccharibacteria bacterium]